MQPTAPAVGEVGSETSPEEGERKATTRLRRDCHHHSKRKEQSKCLQHLSPRHPNSASTSLAAYPRRRPSSRPTNSASEPAPEFPPPPAGSRRSPVHHAAGLWCLAGSGSS